MVATTSTEQILFVDDDLHILEGMRRQFRRHFSLALAESGEEALEIIQEEGPFAVVVSDRSMPGMDGIKFLSEVRNISPDSTRIMLTGQSDIQVAMDAVNEGQIFRFLTKPSSREVIRTALEAGVEQYHLKTSERVLLTQTLQGSVKVLMDMLELVSADSVGYAERIRSQVKNLIREMQAPNAWEIEIAALLSLIGCVTVPPSIVKKNQAGESLSHQEQEIFSHHPQVGYNLISNIPRMERVAQIVLYQLKNFDGSGFPSDNCSGKDIPIGSRVIKAATDYDTWISRGCSHQGVFQRLRNTHHYDPEILSALEKSIDPKEEAVQESKLLSVSLKDLKSGMSVADDIRTSDGSVLLVRKGQVLSDVILQRVRNYHQHTPVADSISIIDQGAQELCLQEA